MVGPRARPKEPPEKRKKMNLTPFPRLTYPACLVLDFFLLPLIMVLR